MTSPRTFVRNSWCRDNTALFDVAMLHCCAVALSRWLSTFRRSTSASSRWLRLWYRDVKMKWHSTFWMTLLFRSKQLFDDAEWRWICRILSVTYRQIFRHSNMAEIKARRMHCSAYGSDVWFTHYRFYKICTILGELVYLQVLSKTSIWEHL